MTSDPLASFSEPTRAWFRSSFEAPTPAQLGAWRAAAHRHNALVIAPTGSGKTLAGFLWAIDRLITSEPVPTDRRLRVLYVSPLKALAVDIERNLRSPLLGIRAAADRMSLSIPEIRVGVRTGDTPAEERRSFATEPPDILITTPESLFLLLTSQAREALRFVDTVIVDEVHAIAGNKRGVHLALSLERLEHFIDAPPVRFGLSATVRPADEIARFLGGRHPVDVVDPVSDKRFDLRIEVPVEDLAELGSADAPVGGDPAQAEQRTSIWPHVEERLVELIKNHASTLVFCNSRRLSERLCARLNELAGEEVARAHHGSVSKEKRKEIEEALKHGRLPAVVATSSLELGIDMAAVDLVVQVEAPTSVASGLQRIGRAGHQVGQISRGIFFPKFRGDLLECAVVVDRMQQGLIEAISYPRNPLDVLAQHIVSMVAMDEWRVDDLDELVRRAAPFQSLPRSALEETLDMLSGRYPSTEFAELRARIDWDRATDVLTPRGSAQHLAVTSGGTIPDRGLFGVFLIGDGGSRVGELDEEMVYESRPGDVFVLGASSWLIEDITHDRVLVSPAPGQPGKTPFWHGDAPGRPAELGRAAGAFVRELSAVSTGAATERLHAVGLDERAAVNLLAYLQDQKEATEVLPDDRTVVVERFRDEIGDWRVCIHSLFGAQVNAPWAQAIEARLRSEAGVEAQCIHTDDGIIVRLPEAVESPPGDFVVFEPESVEELVVDQVGTSNLFSSRFRECAGRALLLPRRRPGQRTPLWQQRQKSAHLLQVAAKHPSFPIMLETYRECLQDVFDLASLKDLMSAIRRREVRIVEVDTPYPSPFASSLQFGYVSAFMYEGDVPLAERRAQALSLDRSLLAEIMGREELRELIDEDALTHLELELQFLTEDRLLDSRDRVLDALRMIGDLSGTDVAERCRRPELSGTWLEELRAANRAIEIRISGEPRWIAIEDAGRYRDALGTALPVGVPEAYLEPSADPLSELLARYARTHGPFQADEPARRFGLAITVVTEALNRLLAESRILVGEFRPKGVGREWIEPDVLRRLRRRSLAAFRRDVEPVSAESLARFSRAWHGIATAGRAASLDALMDSIERLQGVPLPASSFESQVLPVRLHGYTPALLDQLCASGEVVWAGAGAFGGDDGWIVVCLPQHAPALLPEPSPEAPSPLAERVLEVLRSSGAMFFRPLSQVVESSDDRVLVNALWELVWMGHVTNDTLGPLRAVVGGATRRRGQTRRRRPAFPSRLGPPAAAGRWSLLPEREEDVTRRRHALAEQMLARHGIVTRGTIAAERTSGGFAGVYPVLRAMEESGRCRRGYFVEGLGGAQFAMPGAVDRLRVLVDLDSPSDTTTVLAATDPANPYGAALAWPERGESAHRPGRKPGAAVVLVGGRLIFYVEKGGKTLLSFTDERELLLPAVDALALAARDGLLGRLSVEKADGDDVHDAPFADALLEAGFRLTSRGLRLRA